MTLKPRDHKPALSFGSGCSVAVAAEGKMSGGGGHGGHGDLPSPAVAHLQGAMTVAVHRSHYSFSTQEMAPLKRLQEDRERAPCLQEDQDKLAVMWGVRRKVLVDVLMMCWGMGSWLGVNGTFVQLPLLVERLPEGWKLPAAMVLAVQLGNATPLLYALLRRLRPAASDAPYVLALLTFGALSLLLNAFLYDRTLSLAGNETSFAFLALTFTAASVGCGSSVIFYPYLRHFREVYLATYLVGEGLSGFVPSLIALVQGVGGEPECVAASDGNLYPVYPPPRFGIAAFLVVLSALGALSLVSFALLNSLSSLASERVTLASAAKDEEAAAARVRLTEPSWLLLLGCTAVLNALMNGVMPSVQSYSCMPYGAQAYHLAVTLSAVANPAACLAGVWLQPLRSRGLAALLLVTALPLGYILATAALSPAPPLNEHAGGAALVVTAWVLATVGVSYSRMWLYGRARTGGARGMRATGAATQMGSALGSLLLYVLVYYLHLFTEAPTCPAPAHSPSLLNFTAPL